MVTENEETSDAVGDLNDEDYESSNLGTEMSDMEMLRWKRVFEPDSDSDSTFLLPWLSAS